jgi:nitrilase
MEPLTAGPVTVAAVQAAPVLLDRDVTIGKVVALTEQAAAQGARLVVFPEAFVPGYPDWVWRTRPWDGHATALYDLLLDHAVVIGSSATDVLAGTARRLGIWLSVGVSERDEAGSTLYNTLLHFGPDGTLAARHRKLMPAGGERLVWGTGDGSTLTVTDTGFGRLGGLICWENYMPLARAALYAQGVDIYLAPTWDNSDVWVPTLRHIAKEGRTYVIGVTSCIRATDLPAGLPGRAELYGDAEDWLSRGNTAIIGPRRRRARRSAHRRGRHRLRRDRRPGGPGQPPAVRPGRPLQPQRRPAPGRRRHTTHGCFVPPRSRRRTGAAARRTRASAS